MTWVATSETDIATETLEERLWAFADRFRAYTGLKSQETEETGCLCRMNFAA